VARQQLGGAHLEPLAVEHAVAARAAAAGALGGVLGLAVALGVGVGRRLVAQDPAGGLGWDFVKRGFGGQLPGPAGIQSRVCERGILFVLWGQAGSQPGPAG
jgi:hypothetical protein